MFTKVETTELQTRIEAGQIKVELLSDNKCLDFKKVHVNLSSGKCIPIIEVKAMLFNISVSSHVAMAKANMLPLSLSFPFSFLSFFLSKLELQWYVITTSFQDCKVHRLVHD